MNSDIILLPLLGALIGYFTNWLAVKMLFRPRGEVRVFGVKLPFTPGIIPKERGRLAEKVAEVVGSRLLNGEVLAAALTGDKAAGGLAERVFSNVIESRATVGDTARKFIPKGAAGRLIEGNIPRLAEFLLENKDANPELEERLKAALSRLIDASVGGIAGAFINKDKAYYGIKAAVFDYLERGAATGDLSAKITEIIGENFIEKKLYEDERTIGEYWGKFSESQRAGMKKAFSGAVSAALKTAAPIIADAIDVRELTKEQINALDIETAEKLILSVTKKELSAITYLGGILGGVIGLLPLFIGR
ncbi:MAG: DUF445 family protein [Clostridiales bacterium]|jgi:uncharacterized membrane protein YheB (UPF0754 family)|nr:DUF445 family protein [Clostridiales bacterium]